MGLQGGEVGLEKHTKPKKKKKKNDAGSLRFKCIPHIFVHIHGSLVIFKDGLRCNVFSHGL